MARYFDDPDYNPRRGAGSSGRVRKEDFSIDGKSWDYRDPYNQRQIDRENIGREKSNVTINPNNFSIANPLYDYDYGRVRDAAKELGINNVNEQSEVDDILNFIRTGQGKKKDEDVKKPEYKPTPLPEDPYGRGGDDRLIGRPFPARPGSGGGKGNVPGSIQYNPPSDNSELGRAISSVADYGNRGTDDYFGRFLPEMGQRNVNEAKATGRSLLSNIQKFQGKVPSLGDPKDLFEYYLGKLKD